MPYLRADSVCKKFYFDDSETEDSDTVFTDFDFGEDRLEVIWPKLMRRFEANPAAAS